MARTRLLAPALITDYFFAGPGSNSGSSGGLRPKISSQLVVFPQLGCGFPLDLEKGWAKLRSPLYDVNRENFGARKRSTPG
jgi:hypothetical protein